MFNETKKIENTQERDNKWNIFWGENKRNPYLKRVRGSRKNINEKLHKCWGLKIKLETN